MGLTANWQTSLIGALIIGCGVVGVMYPGSEAICQQFVQFLIGAGFLAAADGGKLAEALGRLSSNLNGGITRGGIGLFLVMVLVSSVGCSLLKKNDQAIAESVQAIKSACLSPEVKAELEKLKDQKTVDTINRICSAVVAE